MRKSAVVTAILAALISLQAGSADAATRKRVYAERTPGGVIIQPTRTIIHNPNGTTTIYVTPRRSYLDTGTEVSVGDRGFRDYMLPPGGDPGRSNWFYGPDVSGAGGYPLRQPFYLPGFNPQTPF